MQMAYTPRAWAQERAAWKAVIQLNLIRSVNAIVDALAEELSFQPPTGLPNSSPPSPLSEDGHSGPADAVVPPERRGALLKLRMRLTPLRQVEADLKTRLGAGTSEVTEPGVAGLDALMATPFDEAAYAGGAARPGSKDVVVRSHRTWKDRESARKERDRGSLSRPTSPPGSVSDARDSATEVLAGCADDLGALWHDGAIRELVRRRRLLVALGDSAE